MEGAGMLLIDVLRRDQGEEANGLRRDIGIEKPERDGAPAAPVRQVRDRFVCSRHVPQLQSVNPRRSNQMV